METFSALLAIRAGNSLVSGEFPTQRPVTRSFDVFFDLRLDERLSKHSLGWWLETPSRPLWRQSNARLYTMEVMMIGIMSMMIIIKTRTMIINIVSIDIVMPVMSKDGRPVAKCNP